ncbi:hypothetical protein BGX87_24315 [Burkholderia ubonensis]|nr:hypothetical protein BGX87_24315 [Burkholderia ubonensis]
MDKSIIRRHAVALIRQRPRIAGSVDSYTKLLVEFMKVIAAIPVSMSSAPSGQYPGANAVNVQPNQKNLELTHRERPEAQPVAPGSEQRAEDRADRHCRRQKAKAPRVNVEHTLAMPSYSVQMCAINTKSNLYCIGPRTDIELFKDIFEVPFHCLGCYLQHATDFLVRQTAGNLPEYFNFSCAEKP